MQDNKDFLKKMAQNLIEKRRWCKDRGWGYVFYCKDSKKPLSRAEFYEDREVAIRQAMEIIFEDTVLK